MSDDYDDDYDGEGQAHNNCFRDEKVHVMAKKCSTCIYRPGNLMRLEPGRKDNMEAEAVAMGGVIPCHKTLGGDNAICRGFWDTQKDNVFPLSIAERMGIMAEVTEEEVARG